MFGSSSRFSTLLPVLVVSLLAVACVPKDRRLWEERGGGNSQRDRNDNGNGVGAAAKIKTSEEPIATRAADLTRHLLVQTAYARVLLEMALNATPISRITMKVGDNSINFGCRILYKLGPQLGAASKTESFELKYKNCSEKPEAGETNTKEGWVMGSELFELEYAEDFPKHDQPGAKIGWPTLIRVSTTSNLDSQLKIVLALDPEGSAPSPVPVEAPADAPSEAPAARLVPSNVGAVTITHPLIEVVREVRFVAVKESEDETTVTYRIDFNDSADSISLETQDLYRTAKIFTSVDGLRFKVRKPAPESTDDRLIESGTLSGLTLKVREGLEFERYVFKEKAQYRNKRSFSSDLVLTPNAPVTFQANDICAIPTGEFSGTFENSRDGASDFSVAVGAGEIHVKTTAGTNGGTRPLGSACRSFGNWPVFVKEYEGLAL